MTGLRSSPRAVVRVLFVLCAVLIPGVLSGQALAGPPTVRQIEMTEDSDYFGRDIQILKEVDLETCKSACLAIPACRAFTYNAKASWCFLKDQFRDLRTFPGAISGRVLEVRGGGADQAGLRAAELAAFLPSDRLKSAQKLPQGLSELIPEDAASETKRLSRTELAAQARAARGQGNGEQAVWLAAGALRGAPNDQTLWVLLSEAALAAKPDSWDLRQQRKAQAIAAAANAYLSSARDAQRAQSLATLGRALAESEQWRPAIAALGAALAIQDDPGLRAEYTRYKEQHGFRIAEHRVDSDSATPRICIEFSEALARLKPNLADFVGVPDGSGLSVEVEDRQICADGARHGESYAIQVRQGLPAASGDVLEKTVDLDIKVGDRTPSARFQGRAYVLPKGGEAAIPVISVNADRLAAKVYRIGDRSIARALGDGPFLRQLESYQTERIAEESGAVVWTGTVEVKADAQGQLNREVTTAIPVGALVPDLKPGVYALSARPSRFLTQSPASSGCDEGCGEQEATQWFVVSDLGLTALTGNDGLHALVRSLSTAQPVAGVQLRLIARNNEILAEATTDAAGYAQFAPGLLRGEGGNAPLLLTAQGKDGDYGLLDIARTPFDLSDRGVTGRPSPKPLDVFMVTERGVYRPGETVHFTALVRDPRAAAAGGVPLTLAIRRPDGVERERTLVPDSGLGGHQLDLKLSAAAMRGTWRAQAYSDPKGAPLADVAFLVEDFLPDRLDFALKSQAAGIDPQNPQALPIDARFLYGAPAAGLKVEGETQVKAVESLPDWPGYRFGLLDDQPDTASRPLDQATTDAQGRAEILPLLPELTPTSRPLSAELAVRVLDTGGRPVERTLTLPVLDGQSRVGIKPLFEGEAPEGGTAGFELVALAPDGSRRAATGLAWTLERVQTDFQWYRSADGTYDYESIERASRVASGTLDLDADSPGRIEAPVEWGAYRLRVDAQGLLPASLGFEAGWYVTPQAADTPDQIKLSLDKPSYRVGERARVHLEPRGKGATDGLALVMVVDDRLIAMQAVEVPPEGTTLDLPVTEDWGPGAYVTAALYRPVDLKARRMPGRAIGLAWAGVDQAERRLAVDLAVDRGAGPQVRPRAPMTVRVKVPNLKPGTEAYITLAAVDQGILNVTGYKPPEPDAWYFGQRRLGMEIRDLYGQLIDRMQGAPGIVRSGGDGGMRMQAAPPPSEEPMVWFSGVVRLDSHGQAALQVPVPDFNGTVRLMAMAWSAAGVGHGVSEALVRDPVVVTAGLPRFLAPGDRSRLLLGLTLVEGEGGDAQVTVGTEKGLVSPDAGAATRRLTLAPGVRTDLAIPIEALGLGDETMMVRVATPTGQVLEKRLTLGVRNNAPTVMTVSAHALNPGAEALVLAPDLLEGLVPGSGSVLVSVSRAGRLDLVGILRSLDRYPHGCTEQTVSRALPLLYLDKVALAAGLSGDPAVPPRIAEAIVRVLANASSDGQFGLWGPGGDDLWLDAFATDFLTRARERGFEVPQAGIDAALNNLKNRAAYASPGVADAYALYVLARNGKASIGDLRYLADERLKDLGSPMAKAQVGAALALYGDRTRADAALAAAAADLASPGMTGWRSDYGSSVRDVAAVLALAAESGSKAVDLHALAGRVQDERVRQQYLSTQDNAWLLLAANALTQGGEGLRLEVDGATRDGAFYGSFDSARLDASPVLVRNRGTGPVDAMVGVLGVPSVAPPAGGNGYAIERAYYDLEGRRMELVDVPQGERVLAVVTVRADPPVAARLIVDDPLPAGFEIDNPNLLKSADIAQVPGLTLLDSTAHREFRSDRFVAAVERAAGDPGLFQLGYLLRAVTPGNYVQPPASVEDMYEPARRAWTAAGSASVIGAAP